MVVKDTNISQKIKNESWLGIEKNVTKSEKRTYYSYKTFFI